METQMGASQSGAVWDAPTCAWSGLGTDWIQKKTRAGRRREDRVDGGSSEEVGLLAGTDRRSDERGGSWRR